MSKWISFFSLCHFVHFFIFAWLNKLIFRISIIKYLLSDFTKPRKNNKFYQHCLLLTKYKNYCCDARVSKEYFHPRTKPYIDFTYNRVELLKPVEMKLFILFYFDFQFSIAVLIRSQYSNILMLSIREYFHWLLNHNWLNIASVPNTHTFSIAKNWKEIH